jgi:hypothetical protein
MSTAGYTFTTLKSAIQNWADNTETTFTAELSRFITNAEERIFKEVDLDYFRKNVQGTMTNGGKYLGKPTDYLASFSLSYTDSDGDVNFLLQKDVNYLQTYTPAGISTTGLPRYYAPFDVNNFILAPTPNAAFTTELHYFYRPTSITATDDGTSWLGDNAPDAMLYASLVEAYIFMKGEPDLIQLYTQRWQESLLRLKNYAEGMENSDNYRQGMVTIAQRT